jgi:hypothetical protein
MIPSKPKTKSSSRDLSEPALASRTFEVTGQAIVVEPENAY